MTNNTTRREFIIKSIVFSLAVSNLTSGCSTISNIPKKAIHQGYTGNHFDAKSTAEEVTMGLDLSGKTVLITGANSGLGFETMRVLALRGAHVLASARNMKKARIAAASVSGKVTPIVCELTDFESIVKCSNSVKNLSDGKALDALICNAGMMAGSSLQTVYGLEKQFVVNYLGHFLLAQRLLPNLEAAPQGRLVLVSSGLYKKAPEEGIDFDNLSGKDSYDLFAAYGQSKLAVALFAVEFTHRLSHSGVTANALYPGIIQTNLFRNMPWYMRLGLSATGWIFMKSVAEGTATQCYLASHPSLAKISGHLFADCNPVTPEGTHLSNRELSSKLWDVSLELTKNYR